MAAAVPLALSGGQAIFGAIQNHKANKALKAAQAERSGMLTGATGATNSLQQSGNQLTQSGMGAVNPALGYYQTLLGGNRAAMAGATAGARGAITDQYRGAERSIEQSGARGAGADQLRGDLLRDRTSKISGLTTGVQPMAAEALSGIGSNLIGQGGNRLQGAGGLWGSLLGNSQRNVGDMQQRADTTGAQFGSSLFDVLGGLSKMKFGKGGGSSIPGGFVGPMQY